MSETIMAAGATHVGQRSCNEDAFLIDDNLDLFLVADGVGGHQAGDVASQLSSETIAREIDGKSALGLAIRTANQAVMAAAAEDTARDRMGSTVVAAHFSGQSYHLAWVGDSRAYLWDGRLQLLTRDHSYVQTLFDQGQISVEQAHRHPKKNIILQALGMQEDGRLGVGENQGTLVPGQLLLLCSDGLSDAVDSAGIASILEAVVCDVEDKDDNSVLQSLHSGVDALVNAAVEAGGRDNITAVLLACPEAGVDISAELPACVWSFDPASGAYTGLPPAVGTVTPVGSGPISPRVIDTKHPEVTDDAVLMATGEPSAQRETGAASRALSRRSRVAIWLFVGALAIMGLFYSLGLEGSG